MVLLVPMLGGEGGAPLDIVLALGKAAAIIVLVLVVARRVMPPILEAVARTCSQEIFLLTVVGICLGTAYLTSLAGVSLSLGAFLAGLIVSESRFSHLAFGEILPLQILFSAMFFVSVGLLLDVGFIFANPLPVLGVIAAVLVVKALSTGVGLLAMRYPMASAAGTAVILAQIGEFSFVLERTGRDAGLYPAGVTNGGPETFIAATVALMIASPLMYRLAGWLRHHAPAREHPEAVQSDPSLASPRDLQDHVIIAGYGQVGRGVAQLLDTRSVPYLVVTLSPEGAREAEHGALRVLRGNYTRQYELELAGVRTARFLIVADDDVETTRQVVASAHALNPEMHIIARTQRQADRPGLEEAGATHVVSDEQEGFIRFSAHVLELGGASADDVAREIQRLRSWSGAMQAGDAERAAVDTRRVISLTDAERASQACSHAREITGVQPRATGCEECLRLGWSWVHLRICMSCGHVGCCDSSRGRHATQHFRSDGHPIVKSLEALDDWTWCYADKTFL
jgi:CPA2 family monovalent cation:H+ antiporter-2